MTPPVDPEGDNSGDSEDVLIPVEILREAEEIALNTLPEKSRRNYLKQYNAFKAWRSSRNIGNTWDEKVLLTYVRYLHIDRKLSSASVWSYYSMLTSCVRAIEGKDISDYKTVKAYISKYHKDHIPKQAAVLTRDQINKFMHEAPNVEFGFAKVVMSVAAIGMCRCEELLNLTMDDVTHVNNAYIFSVRNAKNFNERIFKVIGYFYTVLQKYMQQRADIPCPRFFLNFRDGLPINQPAGKSTIGNVPKVIADYLNLPKLERYTSHSMKRSSASAFIAGGGTDDDLMRYGKWKSPHCARRYVEIAPATQDKYAHQISNAFIPCSYPSSSTITSSDPVVSEPKSSEVAVCTANEMKSCPKRAPTCGTALFDRTSTITSSDQVVSEPKSCEVAVCTANQSKCCPKRARTCDTALFTNPKENNPATLNKVPERSLEVNSVDSSATLSSIPKQHKDIIKSSTCCKNGDVEKSNVDSGIQCADTSKSVSSISNVANHFEDDDNIFDGLFPEGCIIIASSPNMPKSRNAMIDKRKTEKIESKLLQKSTSVSGTLGNKYEKKNNIFEEMLNEDSNSSSAVIEAYPLSTSTPKKATSKNESAFQNSEKVVLASISKSPKVNDNHQCSHSEYEDNEVRASSSVLASSMKSPKANDDKQSNHSEDREEVRASSSHSEDKEEVRASSSKEANTEDKEPIHSEDKEEVRASSSKNREAKDDKQFSHTEDEEPKANDDERSCDSEDEDKVSNNEDDNQCVVKSMSEIFAGIPILSQDEENEKQSTDSENKGEIRASSSKGPKAKDDKQCCHPEDEEPKANDVEKSCDSENEDKSMSEISTGIPILSGDESEDEENEHITDADVAPIKEKEIEKGIHMPGVIQKELNKKTECAQEVRNENNNEKGGDKRESSNSQKIVPESQYKKNKQGFTIQDEEYDLVGDDDTVTTSMEKQYSSDSSCAGDNSDYHVGPASFKFSHCSDFTINVNIYKHNKE